MTDTELLPCAHCGSPAKMQKDSIFGDVEWIAIWVECSSCYIKTSTREFASGCDPVPSIQCLAESWNRRAPAEPTGQYTDDEYECLKADYEELEGLLSELCDLAGIEDDGNEVFYSAQDIFDLIKAKLIPPRHVVVPIEPTEAISRAGGKLLENEYDEYAGWDYDIMAADAYRAMIEAAQKEQDHG